MKLVTKHKNDYKTLKRTQLIEILDEVYAARKDKSDHNTYDPINSIRNNARRALKKAWAKRHSSTGKKRVKKHLLVLIKLKNDLSL